jgi:hypothetical protein
VDNTESTYICKFIDNRLKRNIYIKRFFTVFLLAIFALSNTPTKYLHYLFANHKDYVSKTLTNSPSPQINASGINCHCDTNVIIAPYTMQNALVIAAPVRVFSFYNIPGFQKNISSKLLSFGLRGPPFIS